MSLDKLIKDITQLPADKQLKVVSIITYNLSKAPPSKPFDIRKLRGLGKEIWQGIDAREYVNKERESWNS
ncbi:MAG: hypothetical protein HZA78_12930 [Candidatus Schekmanbacteria bacterium]|nr:hypothetical protein [Candidatus Schekmanbacteria bacterium]